MAEGTGENGGGPALSAEDVRGLLEQRLADAGSERLQVGGVEVVDGSTIRAMVSDAEGRIVLTVEVNRQSGGIVRWF